MAYVALDYPATRVPASLRPSSWQNFVGGIEMGVYRAYEFLKGREHCAEQTNERVILAGYSQGAMVMHRLYADLRTSGQEGIVDRIDGVILIADGDRSPGDRARSYGSASAESRGVTRTLNLGGARAVELNPDRVHSLCNKQDIVCDTKAVVARAAAAGPGAGRVVSRAKRVHGRYSSHREVRNMVALSMSRAGRSQALPLALVEPEATWKAMRYWKIRPSDMLLARLAWIKNLRWSRWDSRRATGTGTYWVSTCDPTCVEGEFRQEGSVKVTLSAPSRGRYRNLLIEYEYNGKASTHRLRREVYWHWS